SVPESQSLFLSGFGADSYLVYEIRRDSPIAKHARLAVLCSPSRGSPACGPYRRLLRLAEQVRAGLGHLAIGLRAGEGSPPGLGENIVAIPRVGLLQRCQIGAGVGGVLEPVDADRRKDAHDACLLGLVRPICRGAAEDPAAPLETDDHGENGAAGGALEQAFTRVALQDWRHFHEISFRPPCRG